MYMMRPCTSAQNVLHAVGLLTAHLAKVRGAKQIISIDCVDYRLDRVKQVRMRANLPHATNQLLQCSVSSCTCGINLWQMHAGPAAAPSSLPADGVSVTSKNMW